MLGLQRIIPLGCWCALVLTACNCGDGAPADAGHDAGAVDAGRPDGGPGDSGTPDAGPPDAGTPDAGPPDAGTPDAGPGDAGLTDAGCMPSGAEVCDGRDNDCNGLVDDVDVGNDGIYDCLRIALLGLPGLNGSSNFVAWLTANGTAVVRVQQSTTEALTAQVLDAYDVVILDRLVRDYTPAEAAALSAWVTRGGGVVVMSGYFGSASDWERPNSLLLPLGLGIGRALRSGPVTSFVPHPLTTGLSSVTFSGGYNVGPLGPDGGPDFAPAPDSGIAVVVATLPTGAVGVAESWGSGRVFVWGDEWIQFDSEWQSQPQIPLFWANILGWVAKFR